MEDRSIPIPEAGCWLWLLSTGSHGYGQGTMQGYRVQVAHRISYQAFVGPIPRGMLVQHSCDNKWCVAPYHLSLGTDATNAEDKRKKGRAAKKLTSAIAAEIRVADGLQSHIAKKYGVDPNLVNMIKKRKIWKDA